MLLKREKSPGLSLKTFTQKPRNSRLINQPSTCLALGFQGRMTWSHSASFPPVISFPQISQRNSFVFEYFQHVREKTMLFFSSRTLHPAKFSHVTVSQPRIDQPWKTKRESPSDISSSNDRVTLDPKCRFARFPRFTRATTSTTDQVHVRFLSCQNSIDASNFPRRSRREREKRAWQVHTWCTSRVTATSAPRSPTLFVDSMGLRVALMAAPR